MKKILILLLGSLLILFGCSSSESDQVELTFMIWGSDQAEAYQNIIDQYEEENPNVTVELQVKPYNDYWTALDTAFESGDGPDVFWIEPPKFLKYQSAGFLAPVEDGMAANDVSLDDYDESLSGIYNIDGTQYAVPLDVGGMMLYYNEDILAEAGVTEVPTTWDELLVACEQIYNFYDGAITPLALDYWNHTTIWPILLQGGSQLVEDDNTSSYDSQTTQDSVQFFLDLIEKGYLKAPNVTGTGANMDALVSGQAAFAYGGSWEVQNVYTAGMEETINIAPLPTKDGTQEYVTTSGGLGAVVNAQSEHVEEATDFAGYLGTDYAAEQLGTVAGVIPAKNGFQQYYVDKYPASEGLAEGVNSVITQGAPPPMTIPLDWQNVEIETWHAMLSGEMSMDEGFAIIDEAMNEALIETAEIIAGE